MSRKAKIKTIDVEAKEWYDRTAGNSYCSGRVTINFGTASAEILPWEMTIGYGDYYIQAAKEVLQAAGKLPQDIRKALTWYCRENNIILRYDIERKCKMREVEAFGFAD